MRPRKGVLCYFLVTLVVLILFLPSCDQKESTVRIDQKGGTVQAEGTSIMFPENAVSAPVNVSLRSIDLKKETSEPAETEGLLSSLSLLTLDQTCSQPVIVRIKLPNGAESKHLKLALGIRDQVNGKQRINYQYLDTTIKDGVAEARFIPSAHAAATVSTGTRSIFRNPFISAVSAAGTNFTVYVGLFESTAWFKTGGHFIIHYPGNIPGTELEKFAGDLEAQYDRMLAQGYTYEKRTVWPVDVYLKSLKYEGLYVESGLRNLATGKSPDHGWLEFNLDYFKEKNYQQTAVRPVIAHEWFHFVQANYVTLGNASLWIDEATATYMEWTVSQNMPAPVMMNWSDICKGVIPAENTQDAGYARFIFMDYLAKTYGDAFIREMYQDIARGTKAEIALQNATAAVSEWAAPAFSHALSGKFSAISPYGIYQGILGNQPPASKIGQPFELVLPDEKALAKLAEKGEPIPLGSTTVTLNPFGARLLAITLDSRTIAALNDNMQLTIRDASVKKDSNATGGSSGGTSGGGTSDNAVNGTAGSVLTMFNCTNAKSTAGASAPGQVTAASLKKSVILGEKLLLLVTDRSGLGGSVQLNAELTMSPKLEEVAGEYKDGSLLIEKVFISDEMRQRIIDKNFASLESGDFFNEACDAEMIVQLEKLPGTKTPVIIHIEQTGPDSGNWWNENVDQKTDPAKIQRIPFKYAVGNLLFYATIDNTQIDGIIRAAYGELQTITLSGRLRFSIVGSNDDLYMEFAISGSKALPKAP